MVDTVNTDEHTVIAFPTDRKSKASANQRTRAPTRSLGEQAPNETILTEKYTILMLQKTTTVIEDWLIGCKDGEAVKVVVRDEKNVTSEFVFPGAIAECLFGDLLGNAIKYTRSIKVSGKQVGEILPNTADMVWLKEESHRIQVMDGKYAGASFVGAKNSLSAKPL